MELPAPSAREPVPEPGPPQVSPLSPPHGQPFGQPQPQPHDLGYATPPWPPPPAGPLPAPARSNPVKRALAPFAAAGVALVKWGAILFKLKAFTLVGSMVVSLAAYTWAFGFTFALGFIMLLFVHEMGHVVVLRMRGIKAGLPVFLPFLGAFVTMKEQPKTAYDEALSGLAGPGFGMAAAGVVAYQAHSTGSLFLYALAHVGFLLNVFNMLPFLPLDGGRAAAALHPSVWALGLGVLLFIEIRYPSPIIPIVLILGAVETWRRWKNRDTDAQRRYNDLTAQQRLTIGAIYVLLVAIGIWGTTHFYIERTF